MKGLGQHTEDQREAKTAGEYRQAAEEHTQTLKDFWKNFMVSGLFVVAAVVIILACLAWFFNNSQVTATGVGVSAAGARYSIMADGDKKGVYDQTSGLNSSDSMNVSTTSNLNNYDGTGTLGPGSYGQITFTVTPMTKDLGNIKIQLSREFVPSSVDNSVKLLASGHILFFEGVDGDFYKDPILGDWLTIKRDSFCEEGSSETTKSVARTLYWAWPEHFRNIVLTGRLNYEKNLFASTSSNGYSDLLNLINGVNDENSWQRFFVAKPTASASASMSTSKMQECSDAYDVADEKIGREIRYMQIRLTAEEEPAN